LNQHCILARWADERQTRPLILRVAWCSISSACLPGDEPGPAIHQVRELDGVRTLKSSREKMRPGAASILQCDVVAKRVSRPVSRVLYSWKEWWPSI